MTSTWVVIKGDGDIDYTNVYIAEGVTNAQEARELELRLPEDNGDDFYRVVPLLSNKDLEDVIAEQDGEDEDYILDSDESKDDTPELPVPLNQSNDEITPEAKIASAYAYVDDVMSKFGGLFGYPQSPDTNDEKKSQ